MRILHTSDWHLGKRLENFSRLEEQEKVLQEICEIAEREKADVVVISGDLFDTYNPPTEAVDLFYKTLKRLSNGGNRPVIAIAGNHDSPDRIESPDPLARECGIIFAGFPYSVVPIFELETGLKVLKSEEGFLELKLPDINYPLRILFTPYANEYRLKTFLGVEDGDKELRNLLNNHWSSLAERHCDDKGVNLLISHLFLVKKGGRIPEEPEDEKPILYVGGAQEIYSDNIPKMIQYVAMGHLHRMQEVDSTPCPIYYSGSPISYSFAEANQKKFVLMVETKPGEIAKVSKIQLTEVKPLLKKRAESVEEAIIWLKENKNSLVELTLVSETFLSVSDRKRINSAHSGIVSIIPEVRDVDLLTGRTKSKINLNQSMEDLFRDYFKFENGQYPNEDIMNLFNEIISAEEDAK